MRFIASITVGALALATMTPTEAAVRFTEPVWRPDLGISVPMLAGASSSPLELPKAESFMVTEPSGDRRLEDRFDTFDLWMAQTMRGRWRDESGNTLYLARITERPPSDPQGTVRTRGDFLARQKATPFDPEDDAQRNEAVFSAAPVDLLKPVRPRRSQKRNMKIIRAYPSSNDHVLAYAFRPRSPERGEKPDWYLALLAVASGESINEAACRFEEDFIDCISVPAARARPAPCSPLPTRTEADLLRAAVHGNIANYDDWHFTTTEDVVVVDNIDDISRSTFIPALTNGLPCLRRAYAASVPSALSATNQTAIVSVFSSREEYLSYVGIKHKWTAALWDTLHRELVLYLPRDGTQDLLKTVWHEAFHQYLAYAAALVTAAPWFNEGHAELFEHSHLDKHGNVVFDKDPEAVSYINLYAADLADILPDFFNIDYDEFYGGTQEEIVARYRLAWSLAYFLEVGAPKVRFQPFANLRRDYVKELVNTRSTSDAGNNVLADEFRKHFIAAWLNFWKKQ